MLNERNKPWHFGIDISTAKSTADALAIAGLDYAVKKTDIFDASGNLISGYKLTARKDTNEPLGVVTDKYQVVQNNDAFLFADELLPEGLTFEVAGQHRSKVWIQAKLPDTKILGDDFSPYICFTNSHDGSGSVRVFSTPLRIFCSNVLNLAIKKATRSWAFKHVLNVQDRIASAESTILLMNNYMNALSETAEKLATKKISANKLDTILNEMFPVDDETTARRIANIEEIKNDFYECLAQPDVANYKNTAYGAIMAATDFVDHRAASRSSDNFDANRWNTIMSGSPFVDELTARLIAA